MKQKWTSPTPKELPLDIVYSTEREVACDGGNRKLGHPKVYLAIKEEFIECPYCSRRFVLLSGDR